ncbi:Calx-beta domain-containing protein, partial [Candidatus Palauibacter soopunensis]|uniref:Calx-beta domain-containing protein n=1 Tax=Candidatus Palauibacter soopunensis TaxID=3056739 RepID=UPI0023A7077E
EGGDAVFTLTATPAPAADLAVSVSVAADGDWGVTAGSRTVTIPASGSVTLTLATAGDDADEPDGSVTVTVADGSGYTVGSAGSGTVAVRDDDAPLPVVTLAAGAAVTEGGDAAFTLTATPAPAADLAVSVSVAADGDWGVTAGTRTVTIPTSGSATLTLATAGDDADEPDGSVTATVQAGSGYTVGASASGTVAVRDDDLPPPVVTIAAKAESVTEGGDAVFTLTADRAPDADLTVTLAVSETGDGDHVAASDEGPAALVIPKGATEAAFIVATVNDDADEPDGAAVVTVEAGAGYTVGDPASASVEVKDDDVPSTVPALSVGDSTAKEGGRLPIMPFTVRLAPPAPGPVRVYVSTRPSTPVSAEPGQDYAPGSSDLTFRAGETEKTVWIRIYDDSHDEGSETFEVVLSNARGAVIGDGVAVGTIVNDDPMPAAFLARFGRTVAEQALDGIAGRMSAPRTAGMQGAIAGQAVGFGPTESGIPAAGGVPSADGTADGSAALAMKEVAQAFGGQAGHSGHDAGGFGNGLGHDASGFGASSPEPQSRTMSAREALLGSSFSLTAQRDGSGGSMAFWGRAAQGSFDGREGTFSLDGTVTTGMLGADYARGRWLIGLALAQSDGEGDYRDTDIAARAASQDCPPEAAELCRGAVREGDGTVEASLTAAVPYAAFQASERLKLWGAAGYGTGEVTLKTELGGRYSADTSWSMAAAGLRGDLLQAPQEGSGPALAVTSDALWTRTSSEKTRDLAASDSDVTRLRVGLEGSYHVALEDGGSLVPKLEVGARHDGGDAETGFGVELGGGVKWTDPGLGLSLDLSGRTLIAHGNDDLKDRGFSAALAYDPAPATKRGASLSLRQDFGGRAQGGLDALFAPDPLDDRTGSEAASRWALEAAYGLPAFGGRWTGSPHAGFGLSTGARDYSVGWRLTPEAANAPDLSFGVRATRRESDVQAAEHTFGVELTARW